MTILHNTNSEMTPTVNGKCYDDCGESGITQCLSDYLHCTRHNGGERFAVRKDRFCPRSVLHFLPIFRPRLHPEVSEEGHPSQRVGSKYGHCNRQHTCGYRQVSYSPGKVPAPCLTICAGHPRTHIGWRNLSSIDTREGSPFEKAKLHRPAYIDPSLGMPYFQVEHPIIH